MHQQKTLVDREISLSMSCKKSGLKLCHAGENNRGEATFITVNILLAMLGNRATKVDQFPGKRNDVAD